MVASPQIRNRDIAATCLGHAPLVRHRGGWNCYRAGGNICYADTLICRNRELSRSSTRPLRRGEPVHTAPALLALDAQMVIRGLKGERRQRRGLLDRPDRYHADERPSAQRALTWIRILATMAGAQFYFEKVATARRGLPAVNGVGDQGQRRQHRRSAPRRQRGQVWPRRPKKSAAIVASRARGDGEARRDMAVEGADSCGTTATRCRSCETW